MKLAICLTFSLLFCCVGLSMSEVDHKRNGKDCNSAVARYVDFYECIEIHVNGIVDQCLQKLKLKLTLDQLLKKACESDKPKDKKLEKKLETCVIYGVTKSQDPSFGLVRLTGLASIFKSDSFKACLAESKYSESKR